LLENYDKAVDDEEDMNAGSGLASACWIKQAG
jgi:hypothetical protein